MSTTHYLEELEWVRRNLVEMGETTLALFDDAVGMISEPNSDRTAKASELEAKTDHQHRLIRDQCLNVITLRHRWRGTPGLLPGRSTQSSIWS